MVIAPLGITLMLVRNQQLTMTFPANPGQKECLTMLHVAVSSFNFASLFEVEQIASRVDWPTKREGSAPGTQIGELQRPTHFWFSARWFGGSG